MDNHNFCDYHAADLHNFRVSFGSFATRFRWSS